MANRSPDGNVALDASLTTVSFNIERFDNFLRSQGVKLVHWRSMRCPVGISDKYDIRRTHEDHSGCSNGRLYTRSGEVTCLFTSNGNKQDQQDYGLHDGGTVQTTAPVSYDGCDTVVDVAPFDRFYLNEEVITVPHSQLVEAHATGHDRLDFPVVSVVDIVDSHGVRHGSDEYKIEDGQVVWTNGGLPFDAVLNKGTVYAIRFTYRPYWYVQRLLHQIRIAQVETMLERKVARMPQQFVLQREYIFEKAEKDPQAPDPEDPRQVKGPRQSSFGPR